MKRTSHLLPGASALLVASIVMAFLLAIGQRPTSGGENDDSELSADVNRAIAAARAATAKYHDLDVALEDGFVNTGLPCIEGQGFHYIDPARIGTLDVDSPQILVYAPGNRLVALEWVIPSALVDGVAPTLFGETFHGPNADGIFFLHVWAWEANPDGMFADANPNIQCDCECEDSNEEEETD
jgi:hypothetical protein